jgi:phospholipase A-2-activating protein
VLRGNKDGELKIFKNGEVPEAYAWKAQEGKWDKIGEVLSGRVFFGDFFY